MEPLHNLLRDHQRDEALHRRLAGLVAAAHHAAKQRAVGVGVALQAPHLVGGGHELPGQGQELAVGPQRPPVRDAVVSSAPEGMAVHHPQQERLGLAIRLQEAFAKGGQPGHALPAQLPPRGFQVLPPGSKARI